MNQLSAAEKAKELVLQFYEVVKNKYPSTSGMPLAKQCALIAQKNLLDKLKSLNIKDEYEEKVLSEINAL